MYEGVRKGMDMGMSGDRGGDGDEDDSTERFNIVDVQRLASTLTSTILPSSEVIPTCADVYCTVVWFNPATDSCPSHNSPSPLPFTLSCPHLETI